MVLVTGCAGFIGFHLSLRLLRDNEIVLGIDNLNSYYDVAIKNDRLNILKTKPGFIFIQADVSDQKTIFSIFASHKPERVVHLAAQAGVRYSLENPRAYTDTNINGFLHVLEGCRNHSVKHLVYASSSSIYGLNKNIPFSTHDNVDHPLSLYAATKKANELMAHTYSHLFEIPSTGLRFFTVYGPWGRPDMAYFLFTKAILNGQPISVFNNGDMRRDFTFVDDVVEGIIRVLRNPAKRNTKWTGNQSDPASSTAPYRLYNIGNHSPVALSRLIEVLEQLLKRKAIKRMLPMQPGDVLETSANVDDLSRDFGFSPSTSLEDGLALFVKWYLDYYKI
jgi:UDP-glucuronate 4-epimerase